MLVPSNHRVGPPLRVPIMEGAAFLAMLVIAAKPGPVPRGARPFILGIFCLLVLSNAAATLMAMQSVISLAVLVVVVARVIKILPG